MPKLKTNKSVRKRFKLSKRKKILRPKSKRRHLLTGKSSSKKRSYRGYVEVSRTDAEKIKKLLPYG